MRPKTFPKNVRQTQEENGKKNRLNGEFVNLCISTAIFCSYDCFMMKLMFYFHGKLSCKERSKENIIYVANFDGNCQFVEHKSSGTKSELKHINFVKGSGWQAS